MNLSLSEQATLHFYRWDYRNRGYYHFDTPVDIETPYIPFESFNYNSSPIKDDGRVQNLFVQIGKLLIPSKESNTKRTDDFDIVPNYLDEVPTLKGISLSFPKDQEILSPRNLELLNILSFTRGSVSFEIVGMVNDISIQLVCTELDYDRIYSQLKAYFPLAIIQNIDCDSFGFDREKDIAIADFGVHDEFMRPINTIESFSIDPLTSIIATLDSLQPDDTVVFQVIFKGITSPLAKDIPFSVSDGSGGSFFSDAPEMPKCAMDKVSAPLFSVVMRIGAQGISNNRSQYLAKELTRNITLISQSQFNKLIPLSNEGYNYDFHQFNLHSRLSNRLGFILNAKELNTFVHYPNKSVVSKKLGLTGVKTKSLPTEAISQKYTLGGNIHNGLENLVTLSDEIRLRHTHIIGATGVGKSTLIANMMIEDMEHGNGCALFDPHGDIVEDILLRIPEHRKDAVILVDPYDTEYPIGFNILQASSDAEKIVLSSDLVGAFKRFATSWGDNMSSVLSQAVNTFLDSTSGGTLIELKRFLLEDRFRKDFLQNVEDPSIHYYWEHEYPYLKSRIAPLLTRIDTFLRPKIVRYMLAQKGGIDFRACIEENKIVLIKLSQGLIGEDNSYLLGSLFLSKFNQVAQSRQGLKKEERHPYYIYCDEFHNFITNSISQILSGARKYGLGLILAHQEVAQIDDYKVLNSVISNPYTRICFRLGDIDAKRLQDGFSYFEQDDLQSLGIGQTIVRIGSSGNDFNMTTSTMPEINIPSSNLIKEHIIQNTRENYSQSKEEVELIIKELLPKRFAKKPREEKREGRPNDEVLEVKESITKEISPEVKEELIKQELSSVNIRTHRQLQNIIKKLGQERGFISHIEYETKDGGRIDVVLEQNSLKIAFEISDTNRPEYEVKNIKKCLREGCIPVIMVSKNKKHLITIENLAKNELSKKDFELVKFCMADEVAPFLNEVLSPTQNSSEIVKGFRVETEFEKSTNSNLKSQILKLLKKKK